MKKIILVALTVTCVVFFSALTGNKASAQNAQKVVSDSKPIPKEVMNIVDKSCVNCHSEPGNGMAMSHVNLSKWDKYSPEKQAAKAKAMCNMVSKDKMPPKKFRENHPEGVPSKEEIKTICDWAESLQPVKK
jgi:hypothetical protein